VATKGSLQSYEGLHTLPPATSREGVRVVTRNDGKCLDVVASPSSSYLLPDLSEFSLVKGEAYPAGFGRLMLCGGAVRVDRLSDQDEAAHLKKLLSAASGALQAVQQSFPYSTYLSSARVGLGPAIGFSSKSLSDRSVWTAHATIVPSPITQRIADDVVVEEIPDTAVETLEETPSLQPLRPDAPVADIASRVASLTGLGDEMLGHLFKVERETFCRWRTGVLTNPRIGNRRRLGLLLSLVEDLAGREVNIKDWLLNHATVDGLTPYQLLEKGRIDDVAYLASSIGEPVTVRDRRVSTDQESEPLVFGDDDVWETQVLDDEQ
jgi:hypothetical protein